MITTLWLIIAFLFRKRYLPKDAKLKEKLFYYGICVFITPFIAFILFHIMIKGSSIYDYDFEKGEYKHESKDVTMLSGIDF